MVSENNPWVIRDSFQPLSITDYQGEIDGLSVVGPLLPCQSPIHVSDWLPSFSNRTKCSIKLTYNSISLHMLKEV